MYVAKWIDLAVSPMWIHAVWKLRSPYAVIGNAVDTTSQGQDSHSNQSNLKQTPDSIRKYLDTVGTLYNNIMTSTSPQLSI